MDDIALLTLFKRNGTYAPKNNFSSPKTHLEEVEARRQINEVIFLYAMHG